MTSFFVCSKNFYKCCVESSVNFAAYSFSTFLYSTMKHFVCLNAVSHAVSPTTGLQWLAIVEISCRTSAGTSDSIWALFRTPLWSTHRALLKKHFTKHCTVSSTGSIFSKSRLWSCVNCLAVTLNWSLHSCSASSSSVVGCLNRLIEREFDCPEMLLLCFKMTIEITYGDRHRRKTEYEDCTEEEEFHFCSRCYQSKCSNATEQKSRK